MAQQASKPAPLETGKGKQMDDNIDDLGNKGEQGKLEQPTEPKPKENSSPKR